MARKVNFAKKPKPKSAKKPKADRTEFAFGANVERKGRRGGFGGGS